MTLKAPFPYFGGKATVADIVWQALGDVGHYVEPFFGSGAVMLRRPHAARLETVNDADALLSNFWRAVRADPDGVAAAADWPVNEADLHARHIWLVGQRPSLTERLMGDPEFHDVKTAGWWVWGACAWIGGGWCSGTGPWAAVDGVLTDTRKLPHLGNAGRGVSRRLPHLGPGRGVNRQLPPSHDVRGAWLAEWFGELSARLRDVRVACGDWSRVCGPSVLRAGGGLTGVFLDPPYDLSMRARTYAHESDAASECLAWCIANGDQPGLRIVLAGYAGEHDTLEARGWRVVEWKAQGGYANLGDGRGRDNAALERLWLSPHCLGAPVAPDLFG